jgi:hypothetical protein
MRGVVHSAYDRVAVILAIISLIFVGVHTALLDVRELFSGAAQIGSVLYDFFLAYFVSYIFYLIVVALPRQRDLHTSQPMIREAVRQIVGDESVVMSALGQPISNDIESAAELNITDLCQKKDPKDGPERAYLTGKGVVVQKVTVWTVIKEQVDRSQRSIDRLLRLTPLLDAELVRLLVELEGCSIFVQVQNYFDIMTNATNTDMASWAPDIENYHLIVKRLEVYQRRELGRG